MTLGDITTFDICKLKNGSFAMVFPNRNDKTYGLSLWQSNATSLYYLCSYNCDFICTANSDTDGYCIEKIYRPLHPCNAARNFFLEKIDNNYFLKNHDLFRLIWQRKEPKKLTVKEISELLGYEVEIVAEK